MTTLLTADNLLFVHVASVTLLALMLILSIYFCISNARHKKEIANARQLNEQYKMDLERKEHEIRNASKGFHDLQRELARKTGENESKRVKIAELEKEIDGYSLRVRESNDVVFSLNMKLKALSVYKEMPDAFVELENKRIELGEQIIEARKKSNDITAESNLVLKQARERADKVLADADKQAEQIAGDAWKAKHRSEEFRKTAQAMENIIKGYGDEYLIPNETLIDDLAEEYSFEEAGRQLKMVRSQIKVLIKDGKAADCDYKEAVRRQRSIEFALDAYNGKAETILAKVKTDNFGIMKKRLDDAYRLVNHNGLPFRNARILPRYAELYQSQLKYAVQTKELKKRDKEEQQRIKAEMREEERAQREFKKAQIKAEKERKLILSAVKEAERKLAVSAEAERLEFQTQLDELMGKLSEAEAKNQRVMSMAQQTKQGHVYIISNVGSFGEDVVKIGMTRRLEPLDRVKELGDASVPFSFDVHAIIYSEDAPKLERSLHTRFNDGRLNKVNLRKEFFSVNLNEIKREIDALELKCHWTMKAEALEHRESIQIKKQNELANSWNPAQPRTIDR